MRYLSLLLLSVLFVSCSSENPENLSKRIDQLISNDNYKQAIELVNSAESGETKADLPKLKEKVHLNYGIYLEYRSGPQGSNMRERMTTALEQYVDVLRINPDNQRARKEIKKIMGIYDTMPDKSPGEEIMADLRELGFDY